MAGSRSGQDERNPVFWLVMLWFKFTFVFKLLLNITLQVCFRSYHRCGVRFWWWSVSFSPYLWRLCYATLNYEDRHCWKVCFGSNNKMNQTTFYVMYCLFNSHLVSIEWTLILIGLREYSIHHFTLHCQQRCNCLFKTAFEKGRLQLSFFIRAGNSKNY